MTGLRDEIAAALRVHHIEWVDDEAGFACGCDVDGALSLPTMSEADRHQVDAILPIIERHIAALTAERDEMKRALEALGRERNTWAQRVELRMEDIFQAWHGTTEPWAGCVDNENVLRVMVLVENFANACIDSIVAERDQARDLAQLLEEENAARADHRPCTCGCEMCSLCGSGWPCETRRALGVESE